MSARSHLGTTVYRNHERSPEYIRRIESQQSPVEQLIELKEDDRKTQFVTSSLGDGRPLDMDEYEQTFHTPFHIDFGDALERLLTGGLLEQHESKLQLTDLGRLFYDRVTFNFYPPRVIQWLRERAGTPRKQSMA